MCSIKYHSLPSFQTFGSWIELLRNPDFAVVYSLYKELLEPALHVARCCVLSCLCCVIFVSCEIIYPNLKHNLRRYYIQHINQNSFTISMCPDVLFFLSAKQKNIVHKTKFYLSLVQLLSCENRVLRVNTNPIDPFLFLAPVNTKVYRA